MSEPESPFWLAWVLPIISFVGLVAEGLRRILRMHIENQTRFGKIENTLERIEDRMRRRWGDHTWGDDP